MKYIYNKSTGRLHVKDFCYHARVGVTNSLEFDTEDEARRYAGNSLCWCKNCESKRERVLKEKEEK